MIIITIVCVFVFAFGFKLLCFGDEALIANEFLKLLQQLLLKLLGLPNHIVVTIPMVFLRTNQTVRTDQTR